MGHPTALSADEERDVLDAAVADTRIKKVVSGRHARVLVGAIDAGRRDSADTHHAVAGFYDYTTGKSVAAVIDLDSMSVVDVQETSVQPQLSSTEASEAERLAASHPMVKELLKGRALNPLTRLYFPAWAERNDPPHRYAVVFARPSKHERMYAIVDLTDEAIAEVLTPDDIKSQ